MGNKAPLTVLLEIGDGWAGRYLLVEDGRGSLRVVGCVELDDPARGDRVRDDGVWDMANEPINLWRAREAFLEGPAEDPERGWWMSYDGVSQPVAPPRPVRKRGRPKTSARQLARVAAAHEEELASDSPGSLSRRRSDRLHFSIDHADALLGTARRTGMVNNDGTMTAYARWLIRLDAIDVTDEVVESILVDRQEIAAIAQGNGLTESDVRQIRSVLSLIRGSDEPSEILATRLGWSLTTLVRLRSGEWGAAEGGLTWSARCLLALVGSLHSADVETEARARGLTVAELRARATALARLGGASSSLTDAEQARVSEHLASAAQNVMTAAERADVLNSDPS